MITPVWQAVEYLIEEVIFELSHEEWQQSDRREGRISTPLFPYCAVELVLWYVEAGPSRVKGVVGTGGDEPGRRGGLRHISHSSLVCVLHGE
jgi:hypothetical protein